jgi:hypothetical protein
VDLVKLQGHLATL